MSQITKTAKSTMILAAGAVAGVLLAGNVTTTANAETVYFGYETSFREAKQMCSGMHGRIFETERGQYACTGESRVLKKKRKIIPPAAGPANDRPSKRQNFTGRDFTNNIGKVGGGEGGAGGGGNSGGGGGNGGGGSAGGPS